MDNGDRAVKRPSDANDNLNAEEDTVIEENSVISEENRQYDTNGEMVTESSSASAYQSTATVCDASRDTLLEQVVHHHAMYGFDQRQNTDNASGTISVTATPIPATETPFSSPATQILVGLPSLTITASETTPIPGMDILQTSTISETTTPLPAAGISQTITVLATSTRAVEITPTSAEFPQSSKSPVKRKRSDEQTDTTSVPTLEGEIPESGSEQRKKSPEPVAGPSGLCALTRMRRAEARLRSILKYNNVDSSSKSTASPSNTQPEVQDSSEQIRIAVKRIKFSKDVDFSKDEDWATDFRESISRYVYGKQTLISMREKVVSGCDYARDAVQNRSDEITDDVEKLYLQAKSGKCTAESGIPRLFNPWAFGEVPAPNRDVDPWALEAQPVIPCGNPQPFGDQPINPPDEEMAAADNGDEDDYYDPEFRLLAEIQALPLLDENAEDDPPDPDDFNVADALNYAGGNDMDEPNIVLRREVAADYIPREGISQIQSTNISTRMINEIVLLPSIRRLGMTEENRISFVFVSETQLYVSDYITYVLYCDNITYKGMVDPTSVPKHEDPDVLHNLKVLGRHWGLSFSIRFKSLFDLSTVTEREIETYIFAFADYFLKNKFCWMNIAAFLACCGRLALDFGRNSQVKLVTVVVNATTICLILHSMVSIQTNGGWYAFDKYILSERVMKDEENFGIRFERQV